MTVSLPVESTRRRLSALSQFLFVPDNKVGWMPFALRAGRRELRDRSYDAVFASAPPYTALLVADRLSAWGGLPLAIDFRDDWLGNPRHRYPTRVHAALHRKLERRVVARATTVIAINEHILEGVKTRAGGDASRFHVLPQGFDPADFSGRTPTVNNSKMRLVYSGVFYDVQTPDVFLRALKAFLDRTPAARGRIEAVFVGLVPTSSEGLIHALDLDEHVSLQGYLSHGEAVAWLRRADVLWMTVGRSPGAEGISTSKLFEYMGARKTILALVPEGEARDALAPYGASFIADPDDIEQICRQLGALWSLWEQGRLPEPDPGYIARFDRQKLARQLAALLTEARRDEG